MARSDFGFQIGSALATNYLTDSKFIRAGYIAVDTIAERDALPIDTGSGGVIVKGSKCHVAADDKDYIYNGTAWEEEESAGPNQYLKEASISGNTLSITKKDDTTIDYTPDMSTKVDKVTTATENNFASFDSNGGIKDSTFAIESVEDENPTEAISSNYISYNLQSGKSETEKASARSNIGAIDETQIAASYDATSIYAVGDYCTHDRVLYKCNTAITTAESWNVEHWTATNVMNEIMLLISNLS